MAITLNGNGTLTGVSVGGLPDGIVDTDMLAANAVTAAKATGSAKGITMQDSWVITSSYTTNSVAVITANWARHSAASSTLFGNIGSAMTESSGVFTFPSTGIYLVKATLVIRAEGGGRSYLGCEQQISSDSGSNYTDSTVAYNSAYTGQYYASPISIAVFNVTNASTFRWRLRHVLSDTSQIMATGTNKHSGVTFTRLGDT